MSVSFECPSCGAAQEPPQTPVASVTCPYCGTTVVVPEALRPPPVKPSPPLESVAEPQRVTINLSPDDLARWQQTAMAMAASRRVRRGTAGCSGCGCLSFLLFAVAFAGFMLFIFGFSIKDTTLYKCAVQLTQNNPEVVRLIGTPIKPGTFAWITNYKSSGSSESGHFSTDLSGPKGSGTLDVSGSHSGSNTVLNILFESGGQDVRVHSGSSTCR